MIETLERSGFDDIILETVGVGQANFHVRDLVHTLVVLVTPMTGDTIQAMKAGILEVADICVVNKADLPGAERVAADLRSVVQWRRGTGLPAPALIATSASEDHGVNELDEAIETHYKAAQAEYGSSSKLIARRHYELRAVVIQRFEEIIAEGSIDLSDHDIGNVYDQIATRMPVDRAR
jgi:LAO/AO transport system kinase